MTKFLQSLRRMLASSCMVALALVSVHATDIHVATTGNDTNSGTEAAPLLTIGKALELVQAGDRILIHEGTYNITERIKIPELPTSPEKRCEMRAWPESAVGKVIIDGSNMNPASEIEYKQSRCIYVNHLANYWTFYGLVLQNAKDNGMKIEGSYNIVERCIFRWNNDTGLQIGMYKDFKIEETKSFPISGTPIYNPGYSYCRYNKVINCDSYENADLFAFNSKDDKPGGDADGFACKLFPGPGTEFHGCRAWTNSDDNWDLYMVYHPVVIDQCWAYNAGHLANFYDGREVGFEDATKDMNGNGFKLGGGGSAGGAAFDQSVGAHVVTHCVAFDNNHKGFDQNNAYEGMYILNCTAWGNEYNYRFPTVFQYGMMDIHNCIGWGATAMDKGYPVGNHEFLSPGKEGYKDPTEGTTFNSWTTIDGCHPVKECYKDGKTYTNPTQDHSGEFLSLSVDDFMADREADGSLPNNNFARLKPNSIFKDMGTPFIGFTPTRKMTEAECAAAGLEYITADDIYLPYNDAAPDFGAFETDGVPYTDYVIPDPIILTCTSANSSQEIFAGQPIEDIVYTWNEVAEGAEVTNLPTGLTSSTEGNALTISGTPTVGGTFTITAYAPAGSASKPVSATGLISVVIPSKVLTGDWYLFQDAIDALPEDLLGVLSIANGDAAESVIDPTFEESKDADKAVIADNGWAIGAINLGKSNGSMTLNLKDGALKCMVRTYFTGDRTFKITYTLEGGTPQNVTTTKYKKGAYDLDLLSLANLTTDAQRTSLRSLTFALSSANGGARIYEMYITVPDTETGINNVNGNANGNFNIAPVKVLKNGRFLIEKNGKAYNAQGQIIF